MQTIGKLSIGLCRRWTIPMSLPLPPASLRSRHALRARIPLVPYRTTSTTQSDSTPSDSKSTTRSDSGLVVSGELEGLVTGGPSFLRARSPGRVYFDKTKYIPILEDLGDVLLVCRPRRFGKSLTVSMLRYFHGFEFRSKYDELFKGLDVDAAVKGGKVQPGRYLVLLFDFSRITRSPDMDESAKGLKEEINLGIQQFQSKYAKLLGPSFNFDLAGRDPDYPNTNLANLLVAVDLALQNIHDRFEEHEEQHPLLDVKGIYVLADEYDAYANDYMDPENSKQWSTSKAFTTLKGFWSNIKAGGAAGYGIQKTYITGVTPLLLSDLISGANNHDNISFDPDISTICGLTRSNLEEALGIICRGNEMQVDKHLDELIHYANGFHFCQDENVESVFNTQTALSYLQSVNRGRKPQIKNPPNSEVSEIFLEVCTKSPAAVNQMQTALEKDKQDHYQKIRYEKVLPSFKLSDLATQSDGEGDVSAWQSLLVYNGGLTFDEENPSEFLKIPNLVAAERFGTVLLSRVNSYQFRNALYTLAKSGNPMDVLSKYCQLMRAHDNGTTAFMKTEEMHRNIILVTILENRSIRPKGEYEVRKLNGGKGFADLLITNKKKLYTLIEFKSIKLSFLGLDGKNSAGKAKQRRRMKVDQILQHKAKQLEPMTLEQILKLKFEDDQLGRNGMTVNDWIDGEDGGVSGEVREQLRSYVMGQKVQEEIQGKNFRGFVVVVVGSRHILVREMDRNGDWVTEFQLAE